MRLSSLTIATVLCAVLQGPLSQPIRAQASSDTPERGGARVIVKLKADSPVLRERLSSETDEHRRSAKALGDRLGVALTSGRGIADRVQVVMANGIASAELARRLARERDVEYAVVDERVHPHAAPNDPLYGAGVPGNGPAVGQWYLRAPSGEVKSSIDIETAWSYTTGAPGIIVADLDTGVRFDHPDLLAVASGGKLLPGYDMVMNTSFANDGTPRDNDAADPGDWITADEANDPNGFFYQCTAFDSTTGQYVARKSIWHGTLVSGIIAAITNNGMGMAGVGPNLRVLPVRVIGKCFGYASDIIAGMRWAAGLAVPGVPTNAVAARVINMSLGGPGDCSSAYQDAIAQITAVGTVIVASAGNVGHATEYPANCPGVIGVAGLRHAGSKAGISNLGLNISISAPAGNCVNVTAGSACLYPILTTSNSGATTPADSIYTDSYYAPFGTSFSAPLVSGVAALMLSAQPTLSPYQVRLLLQRTARPFPTTGGDNGDGTPVPQCVVPRLDTLGNPIDQVQCYCTVNTCGAGMLDAGAAVRAAATGIPAPIVQAGGVWWDLADAEDGTGFTISHQGDVIFLAWYTYDLHGKASWLSMTAYKTASDPDTYTGQLVTARGPAFNAVPFDPVAVKLTTVGSGTLRFTDLNNATFSYTTFTGSAQTKPIARTLFGPLPTCTYGAQPDFVHATNYQDLWWVPGGAESGWGLTIAQQGDTLFGAWYTYDFDGSPMWLSVTAVKVAPGVYTGELVRTTGPTFGTVPFDSTAVTRTVVGNATFTFANGSAGTFAYVVNGIAQNKPIVRYLFAPPAGTLCQ